LTIDQIKPIEGALCHKCDAVFIFSGHFIAMRYCHKQ